MREKNSAAFVIESSVTAGYKRRDWIELCVGYGLIMAVIWTRRPLQSVLYFTTIAVLLAIFWRWFEGWTAMGLRATNLLRSLWVVGVALLLAAIAVLFAIRRNTLHVPDGPLLFLRIYGGYAVWSLVQQILLLDFFLTWFLRVLSGKKSAVVATAGIFALAHVPNPILTPLTLLWGLAACLLFLRYRNIYPLALAHAIFGICIAITVPSSVTHHMRVGLGYLQYRRQAPRHRSQMDHIVSTHAWVIAEAPTRRC